MATEAETRTDNWLRKIMEGAFISIVGVLAISIFQSFSANITDVRAEVNRINKDHIDYVRKADLETRLNSQWAAIRELSGTKEKTNLLEQNYKSVNEDVRELSKQVQILRERVASLETKLKTAKVGE